LFVENNVLQKQNNLLIEKMISLQKENNSLCDKINSLQKENEIFQKKNETLQKENDELICVECDTNIETNQTEQNDENVENDENVKPIKRYVCEKCVFYTNNRTEHQKHLKTKKHLKIMENIIGNKYECTICNKKYSNANGLWYHKKMQQRYDRTK
jgi:hypothetical protein